MKTYVTLNLVCILLMVGCFVVANVTGSIARRMKDDSPSAFAARVAKLDAPAEIESLRKFAIAGDALMHHMRSAVIAETNVLTGMLGFALVLLAAQLWLVMRFACKSQRKLGIEPPVPEHTKRRD